MTTFLAGFLAGSLMGMLFVTHAAVVFVFRPPSGFHERAAASGTSKLAVVLVAGSLAGWSMLGVAAAFAHVAIADRSSGIEDSVPYVMAVLFVAALTAIPLALFLRDRLLDLALEYALFIGLFGLLIPALVRAI